MSATLQDEGHSATKSAAAKQHGYEAGATLVVRSTVPELASYPDYLHHLRADFWYSCAYCTLMEWEACGISFEIDHYVPTSRGGPEASYSNLYYACSRCNRQKSDLPDEAQLKRGLRFFRADIDDARDHFSVSDFRIIPLTKEIGEYTTVVLRLNRNELRGIREVRKSLHESDQLLLDGIRALRGIKLDAIGSQSARAQFLRGRADVEKRIADAEGALNEELLKLMAESPLLTMDSSDKTAADRRRYLTSLHVAPKPRVR